MKNKFLPVSTLVVLSGLVFTFQNCSSSRFGEETSLSVENGGLDGDRLLEILDDATVKASSLSLVNDDLFKDDAVRLSAKIKSSVDKIKAFMNDGETSIGDPKVLTEVDYLVYLLSEAGDKLIMADLDKLRDEVAQNRQDLDALSDDFQEFKAGVNLRLDTVEGLIDSLQKKHDDLTNAYNLLRADTELADQALKNALASLQNHVDENIAELYKLNSELAADIVEQKGALEELFSANAEVASLQGKMCSEGVNASQTIVVDDARPVCSGSDLDNANCCLTVDAVDCSTLFPSETQIAARNQCEIIIASIKNHDAQLRAIREVDDKQTELIAGLLDDVDNLNQQTKILADGQVLLVEGLKALAHKVDTIDARLMIVEFKAARAEAAASISERVDLSKAWVAQRQKDIRNRFCHANFHQARKMFDYEAQRHNWNYCHSKLSVLSNAMVSLQNISGMTNGIASLNVDAPCSAVINGKNVESLSVKELTTPAIFNEVNSKCQSGPALVKSKLLNAVKALAMIGPDFRTVDYMKKKAKIAQMIFLGDTVANSSTTSLKYFVDVNPMSAKNMGTVFGQIESVFKNKYVHYILRDSAGRFPADISKISNAKIPASNAVYSHKEISVASSAYTKNLKASEISCKECSWGVVGRTNAGSVVTGALGTSKVSYPKDVETGLCPIQNDVVVLKEANSSDYYAYLINYDAHGNEWVKGYNWHGSHVKVASGEQNFAKGLTRQGRFWNSRRIYKNGIPNMDLRGRFVLNVTRPYGRVYTGKAHCAHFTAAAPLRNGEWNAPNANTNLLYRYLSGYNSAVGSFLDKECKKNMGSKSVVRSQPLTNEENARIYIADSEGKDLATFTRRSIASDSKNTQLASDYWVTRHKTLNYGSANYPMEGVSKTNPFFGSSSTSTKAIKAWRRATASDNITKQDCSPNE